MENHFNMVLALPELVLALLAIAMLLADAIVQSKNSVLSYRLSIAGLLAVTLISLAQYEADVVGITFYEQFEVSAFTHLLKIFSYLAVLLALVYSRQYLSDRDMVKSGDYYALMLFALLGQLIMISAHSMLTIYLGLELMSLALYALVALRRDHLASIESAMKYYVLGSLASGFMLYGMSLVYGATGSLLLNDNVTDFMMNEPVSYASLGLVFIVGGLAFKLGAVPFHMWVPDVYQGAPTAVTLSIAAAPKLATFAIAIRLLTFSLETLGEQWSIMLLILAVASLIIGNLAAILQQNFKRMLAYSTISHIGFVLLGIAFEADYAFFYIVTYVLTTVATFGLILCLSRQGMENDEIADLAGLNKRHPLMALGILVLMFSLAGIPPMVGFYAKLAVLQAVVQAGYLWVAILAVAFSLVGAYYYLRVVKVVYFDEPVAPALSRAWSPRGVVLSINTALIVILGIFPGVLMALLDGVILAAQ